MTKRIQAYFRTEDEAEGAKTALIGFHAEGLDVWELTDPIGGNRGILFPIVPVNYMNGVTGSGGTAYGYGEAPAALPAYVAAANNDKDNDEPVAGRGDRAGLEDTPNTAFDDDALAGLHYVMEIKTSDEDLNAVVHTLRSKNGFVEVFE